MANLNYAVDYQQELSQVFPYVLNFGALYAAPNNGRYRFTNAKTIEIPIISTTGRKDANRDTITTPGRHFDNQWEPLTLTNQRMWDTLVHPADINQTNMVASIGNITKVYNEEQKFPEMDAYCISKIYADWIAKSKTADTTVLTEANILSKFDDLMQKMDEARVPVQGRILYVTPAIKTLLKNASAITRQITSDGSNDGVIKRTVNRLDEVEIVSVTSDLMKTVFDFTSGWVAGVGAKQINMCLIHPLAVITPVSYSSALLDEPSAKTQNKYYYYEESFEDVFILPNKVNAIDFVISA
ncbi:capsid protein [Clostridium beijerinckii]|uniref:capsid protein n=1 Tax=Clostridium beijerinckii TaxID=1520 RepID=UPI001F253EE7|nr:capsid protein [Clostridium beijerinckii]